ncbi:tetratricopeptide repeat protein [Crocosphaera sp. XPORK-15E]|uniref:tetratricopeptide repeat protein n=1 Tax=Crocosphaera sp. XPORK-15E TaxID=3110247 RepID=UPI002B207990|nr:tetratricopeptide repeat protein [Crocosphaera sp. XPORK-15E]MEA5535128.1 tetratricopeptide repeat protein [Crocosphaera sp. XPORK-15E]
MSNVPYVSRDSAVALEAAFVERLDNNHDGFVFHVWGMGGVGKTRLTRKLKEDYQNQADFLEVSFGFTPDIDNSIKLMDILYKQLPNDNILQRNLLQKDPFKQLYQQYWDTINELKNTPIEGKKEVDKEQINLVKSLVSEGASALIKLTPAAAIPDTVIKGTTETAFQVGGLMLSAKDRIGSFLDQHQATKKNRELKALMLEPIPKLTKAFVESLIQRKKPVVLVFDTYEKSTIDIDGWLWQYLIGNSDLNKSKVCLIIAGRKNILKNEPWRKLQQDKQFIYERGLDKFDKSQTRHYLEQINITDSDIVNTIFKVTKGLPYYLDKIRERKERGDNIDFSQLNQDVVNLLLQGLNKTQQQVIQLAACCRRFNQPIIEALISQQDGLYFKTAVDEQLNCFEWLTQRDFVEYINGVYRLDDVARDVFRKEFWRQDEQQFRETHQSLADYFKAQRNEKIFPDSSPAEQYNNSDWGRDTIDFLYHSLYGGKQTCEVELMSHLFAARYFKQDEIVQIPVGEIMTEVDLSRDDESMLIYPLRQFLREIIVAVLWSYAVLEKYPINYEYFEEYNLSKEIIDQTIHRCFRRLNALEGIAKFVALLYKSKRCYPSQRLSYLQQAKQQAEVIATEDDPDFSSELFLWSLGAEFYELEEYETQFDCCETAIKFKPDDHDAWVKRGLALGNLGRYEEAISSFDQALEIKPDYHEAWYIRGLGLEFLARYEEAISSFDQALEIKPDYHEAWYNRGVALGNLGRYEEAISSFDQALEIKPDDHQAWYSRGVALGNLARYEEAISSYNQALEIKPDFHEAWNNRGNALGNLGRYEEAISSFDQALEIKPDDHQAWNNRGVPLGNLGRFGEAISSYDQALEFKPDYHEAWNNRGNALGNLGRFEEAISAYDQALEFKPDFHEAWNNRGVALGNLGRYEEAISSYDQALEFKPDLHQAWYNKACYYALQNNVTLAIENLQQAINLNPNYKDMAKTDTDFDNIREDKQFQSFLNSLNSPEEE